MIKRLAYVLTVVLAAMIQVRLLPELGLERLVNAPLVLLIVTASLERRTLVLTAATASGLLIDVVLLRPLGLTSLVMIAGVLAASQIRGAGDAQLLRRAVALLVGLVASSAVASLLSPTSGGIAGAGAIPLLVNLLVGSALAWAGRRRRTGYQFDQTLRG
jgi:cell shape-determining protein MreD